MGYLDAAVGATNDVRGAFGAAYSHLDRAESQSRDTNMAQEFTDYTAANITRQVSNTMLSQANAIPDMIIKIQCLCELKDDGLI